MALPAAGPALVALWAWAAPALGAAFWALRLALFAVGVSIAWRQIIVKGGSQSAQRPAVQAQGLTSAALQEHDARGGSSASAKVARRARASPAVSELSESIQLDGWSDDGSLSEAEEPAGSGPAPATAPQTPAAAGSRRPAQLAARPVPAAAAHPLPPSGPRPPVTVSKAAPPSAGQRLAASAVADEVLSPAAAAVAEDEDERQALAGAALAAGGDLAGGSEAGEAAEHGGGWHGRRHHKKKPWLNRKIEGLFKPYTDKYQGTGYLVYRGFNRMGKRMERGAGTMGRQLDGAIRDVGSAAVAQVDALLQRWVQFFGVLAFLAIALLPLPNVHVSVSTG